MDGRQMIRVVLFGLISCNLCSISALTLETIVRPGDNITLYCDCTPSTGVHIVWFRNCSHEHQPTLVVKTVGDREYLEERENLFPRFKFLKNESSSSYDLLIINVTGSDEGRYYCGTTEPKVEKDENMKHFMKNVYIYGNITTRITVYAETVEEWGLCWKLLFPVCPAVFILSLVLGSFFCWKMEATDEKNKKSDFMGPQGKTEGENVHFAALGDHSALQKPKKKKTIQGSDLRIFTSVIYTLKAED